MVKPSFWESRGLLTILLLAAFGWSLLHVPWSSGLLHAGGLGAIREIGGALFRPDLSPDVLADAVRATWRTVAYAVAGLSVALVMGVPLGVVASGVLKPVSLGQATEPVDGPVHPRLLSLHP